MKSTLFGKLCFALASGLAWCGAFAAMTTSTVNGVTTYTVPANETVELTSTFPAGTTSVVKDGPGTLVLKAANGSYTGPIAVSNGILRASVQLSLGKGTVTVANGARLESDIMNCSNGTCYFPDPTIEVQGNGPDGNGCLCFYGSGNGDNLFAKVKLLADARFGGKGGRWGVSGVSSAGNLNLNGHKLDVAFEGQFVFRNSYCVISNPGEISIRSALFQGAPKFNGSASNHLRMTYPNGVLTFYNASGSGVFPWTLDIEENSTIQSSGNFPARNNNCLNGPIVIAKGKTLTAKGDAATNLLDLRGAISGEGRFVKESASELYINGSMAQTGGTLYKDGVVRVSSPTHFAQYTTDGKVEVTNSAVVAFWLGTAFSAQSIADIVNHASWAKTAYVDYSLGAPFEQTVPFTKPVSLQHDNNNNQLTWKQSVNGYVNLRNLNGSFLFAPPNNESFDASSVRVDAGTLTIAGGRMHLLGDVADQTVSGTLVITNATVATDDVDGRSIKVASTAGGILEIRAGAVVSNKITVAAGSGTLGAVYQHGGIVRNYARSKNDGWVGYGENAYGYYDLAGGELSFKEWWSFGQEKGVGVLQMTGGKLACENVLPFARGGYGRMFMTGGTVTALNLYLGEQQWSGGPNLGNAWVTLAGKDAAMTVSSAVILSDRTNNFTSVFNLNAGVLTTPNIYKSSYGYQQHTRSNERAFLNCGGGTIRAMAAKNDFFGGTGAWELDRVTLFKGGLTVDTAGYKIVPGAVPFQKPVGRGVKSITYSATKTGYFGSPEVYIEGGGGEGATAYVEFDAKTRTIGDVVVTSPGFNYTSAPTVKFLTADRKNYVTCTVEMTPENEEQECGGICKIGEGELQIVKPCSYTGDTIISNGILGLSYLSGTVPATETLLPTGNTVRLASGKGLLYIQGRAVSLAGFGGAGSYGAGSGGSLNVTDFLCFDGVDIAAGKSLTVTGPITFGDNLRVEVTNADVIPEGRYTLMTLPAGYGMTRVPELKLPSPWRLSLSADGRTLKLTNRTPMMVIIR